MVSPEREISDPSDTTISKPIASADDDENDLNSENLTNEMPSPLLSDESSVEITAAEDDSDKTTEEAEFDSENNDDH